jgi:predicted RNA-binding protein
MAKKATKKATEKKPEVEEIQLTGSTVKIEALKVDKQHMTPGKVYEVDVEKAKILIEKKVAKQVK